MTHQPERKAPTGTITGKPAMRVDWRTPPHLLEAVRVYFEGAIPLDPATAPDNPTRAWRYCARPSNGAARTLGRLGEWVGENGLGYDWMRHGGQVFVNPPYGKAIRDWLAKMGREAARGCEIVALLPAARWEQAYLTDVLREANAVCWIRRRVRFVNPETGDAVGGNPYANYFLGFNVTPWRWREAFGGLGACFEWRAL